jgi:hypothetical protein
MIVMGQRLARKGCKIRSHMDGQRGIFMYVVKK